MEKKLKVGLIGLGGICRRSHMPVLLKMQEIEIVAISDIQEEKMLAFQKDFGLDNVKCFTDYKDLLDMEGLDMVDICSPNYLHSIVAVDALEKGVHVLTEKPDAVSVSEALRMKEAAEKSGKHLMALRNNRYRPASQYMKKYINNGKMGEIYCGRCGWIRRRGIPGKGGWFTTKALSGGGPLIDLGVHMIDLAIWLMGNPKPIAVSGCTYCKFANSEVSDSEHASFGEKKSNGVFDVEDLAMGFIRFDNGACLQIEFSWASNIEKEESFVELRGTKAGMKFSSNEEFVKIFTEEDGACVNLIPVSVIDKNPSEHHGKNIRHFVDVVLNDAIPDFVPEQGVNMIKILEAIYESAKSGKEVRL